MSRLLTALVAAFLISGGTCTSDSGELSSAEREFVLGALEKIKTGETFLSLSATGMTDAGAAALAKALPASKLTELNLNWNSIDDAGASALVKAKAASKLTKLDINDQRDHEEL